jgi:Flp pilus assembly CpaF family ATPase
VTAVISLKRNTLRKDSKKNKNKAKTQVETLQLNQTEEQKTKLSFQIEAIFQDLLSDHIRVVLIKYGPILNDRLGMNQDDLINEIRVQIWKGLLVYDASKGASMKTYLKKLIANRVSVLLKKAFCKKNRLVDYYSDIY